MNKVRAGVVGFRGYSGAELVRILERHPQVAPVLIEHRADAQATSAQGPRHPVIPCTPESIVGEDLTVVFLATPAEVSMELAPGILDRGVKVIDLSGAFRLRTPENYARLVQGTAHPAGPARRGGLRAAGILPKPASGRRG